MNFSEKIELYKARFKFRLDAYATMTIKNGNKKYFCECANKFKAGCRMGKTFSPCQDCTYKQRAPVTDEVIRRHLTGEKIVGFYPLFPDGFCQLAAIDLDEEHTFEELQEIDFYTSKFGLNPYPTTSTSKGWHIYFFFDRPVEVKITRALLHHVCREVDISTIPEIFPKQSHCSDLGSLIRTPLTIPDVKKGRCAFLAREHGYKPFDLEQQFEILKTITPCLADETENQVRSLGLLNMVEPQNTNSWSLPRVVRQCMRKMLETGAVKGQRNDTGLVLAAELKRLDCSEEKTFGAIGVWNLKNQPPLSFYEIKIIVHSAFVHEYSYRCGSDTMRRLLGCEGVNNCPYFQRFLEGVSRNQ